MSAKLGEFEGSPVTKATIKVTNTGDGLSQAMKIDPQRLHKGDTVYVVMECVVGPVSFDPIKNSTTECVRKHVLKAGAATLVDGALVKQAVEAQTAIILEHREKAKGIEHLPTEDELRDAHDDGEHDLDPYQGCPACEHKAGGKPVAPANKKPTKVDGAIAKALPGSRAKPVKKAAKKAPAKKAAARKPAAKKTAAKR